MLSWNRTDLVERFRVRNDARIHLPGERRIVKLTKMPLTRGKYYTGELKRSNLLKGAAEPSPKAAIVEEGGWKG
jgi:hypothetical protein